MSIQGNINGMLGTAAALATATKHVSNQNKELALKNVEAEKELGIAENELEKNNFELSTKMETDKNLTQEQRIELAGLGAQEPGKDLDRYLEIKSDKALNNAVEARFDFDDRLNKYNSGEQKSFPSSKRLDKMKQAIQESNDEITARETLKKNVEIQMKKLEALKGVK